MDKQSRTPAEVIEDRTAIMEESFNFWQGEKEYYVDYHDLYGDEYLDVPLGVCSSPRELFEAMYEVFTKDFYTDFVIWCYT